MVVTDGTGSSAEQQGGRGSLNCSKFADGAIALTKHCTNTTAPALPASQQAEWSQRPFLFIDRERVDHHTGQQHKYRTHEPELEDSLSDPTWSKIYVKLVNVEATEIGDEAV